MRRSERAQATPNQYARVVEAYRSREVESMERVLDEAPDGSIDHATRELLQRYLLAEASLAFHSIKLEEWLGISP